MFQLITAIILVKNEDKLINECIKSLNFCDEILVIYDNSTDGTIDAINRLSNKKVKVIRHPLDNNFSQARNFGLSKARNGWVLFVDSDEVVSDALAYEVSSAVGLKDQNLRNFNGFYIRRIDFMWRRPLKYGETGNIKLLRLARKYSGLWEGRIHEKWKIRGIVGTLKNSIIHRPHQTMSEFLSKINFYTNIRAQELYVKEVKAYWWSIISYPISKFIVNYFMKRGFLDGVHGLVFAITMSFHSFLVRGKLWLMWNKK